MSNDRRQGAFSLSRYCLAAFIVLALVVCHLASAKFADRGFELSHQGQLQRAVAAYSTSIWLDPVSALLLGDRNLKQNLQNSNLLARRAELYRQLKQLDRARDDYSLLLKFQPRHEWYAQRASVSEELGDYKSAIEDLQHALADYGEGDGWGFVPMKVIYKFRIGRDYDAWAKPGDASVAYSEALNAVQQIDNASSGCSTDELFALSNVVWYLHSRRSEDYKKLGEPAAGEKDATEAASAAAGVLANREHGIPGTNSIWAEDFPAPASVQPPREYFPPAD